MQLNTSIPAALANQALYNSQPEEVTMPDSTNQTGTQSTKEATMQQPTPVFDFTATINAALAQAIALATQPLMERIELLERSLVVADKAAQGNESDLFSRMALLEDRFDNITTASDQRIKEIADEVAEQAISAHNYDYDHDEYDQLFNDLGDKVSEAVTDAIDDYDFEDKVRDILRHASVSIDI